VKYFSLIFGKLVHSSRMCLTAGGSLQGSLGDRIKILLVIGFCEGCRTVLYMAASYSLRLGFYRASWCSGTSIRQTCTTVLRGVAVLTRPFCHHRKSPITSRRPLTGLVQRYHSNQAVPRRWCWHWLYIYRCTLTLPNC